MPVYMIRAGENGPVKIGHSQFPDIRLGQLQISHWERLSIIRLFEGGETEEAVLHARFADLHIRGEWHSFSRLMLADLGLIELPLKSEPVEEIDNAPLGPILIADRKMFGQRVRELRRKHGFTQQTLSDRCGVARASLASIEIGRDAPGRDFLLRLSAALNVAFDLGLPAPAPQPVEAAA